MSKHPFFVLFRDAAQERDNIRGGGGEAMTFPDFHYCTQNVEIIQKEKVIFAFKCFELVHEY